MATVVSGNQVRLSNGQTVTAQQGGWYDGQQFWGGTLSNPGQINPQSNQQGAGQAVSQQVVAQTAPENVSYVNEQRANLNLPSLPDANNPTPVPQEAVVAPQTAPNGFGSTGNGFGSTGTGFGNTGTGINLPSVPGIGIAPSAGLNLPAVYNKLYADAGIADKEQQLADKAKAFADAQSKINDDPFLSEAKRTGRIQKLQMDFNNNTKNLQDEIATKKADIQTQLDIQTKQFDINSQSAQQALQQFQVLLESGALSGASGEDIANITRATGMSSSMIQSAIKAQQEKNRQTQVISFDDGTNQGFAVIDARTGQVINKQVVAASKPTASSGGGSGLLNEQRQIANDKAQAPQYATQAAISGWTLGTMMSFFQQYGMTKQKIYDIYSAANYYRPTESQKAQDRKIYGVK